MSRVVKSTGKRPADHTWSADEIGDMSASDFELNAEAIEAAMCAGKIVRRDPGPNPKSVS